MRTLSFTNLEKLFLRRFLALASVDCQTELAVTGEWARVTTIEHDTFAQRGAVVAVIRILYPPQTIFEN